MATKQIKEEVPYCAKCDQEMQQILLPKYEYEEEQVLHNVEAYRCNSCGKIFFTESQAKQMKLRSRELKEYTFGFERKVTISGKSLVIGIPHELAEHLHIEQGQTVKVYPMANEGLIIKKC
ncbi:TPA: AbrB/MazE/SpoVT family DNA-binding domain-containing protein [Candidatus Woesearchaeota archaeon]|nr:AbrB/MazE/SpoVT family DNA-binding domain-containing protein [Candidatus Woesearchaeota archaeon]HIG93482.1 AbrB/MazE/SpoVT family DNA-binding domain-containing protein [Candidatus Woesearchaeota archaeon]HIH12772.1 AbrB/MazE/SpoVT family DNA-binding domain-containing protein [Candidatus Woesearchaeota archaeon]